MRTTRQNAVETGRQERSARIPINGTRDILAVKGIPEEFHPCWVNDTDNNIQKYLDAGYSFWTGNAVVGDRKVDSDSPMASGVIQKNVGNGLTAYLMVIPKDIWESDMAEYHKTIGEKESIMLRNEKQGNGRYGSIKIEDKLADSRQSPE